MYIPLLKKGDHSSLINLISEEQWEDAATRVKYFPKEAKLSTRLSTNGATASKVLPLHHACARNPTLEVTEALLKSYPSAAKKHDSLFKRLPIHVACLYGASSNVIRELLVVHREGAQNKMKDGQIPLHYACGSGSSKEVIEELIRAHRDGVQCQDKNGWLPIHLACLQNASIDIIQMLVNAYPESVMIRTSKGNTPIQCLKSMKNTGTDIEEILAMLRGTEVSLKRRISRCVSTSRIHELSQESNVMSEFVQRKRCNSSIFL